MTSITEEFDWQQCGAWHRPAVRALCGAWRHQAEERPPSSSPCSGEDELACTIQPAVLYLVLKQHLQGQSCAIPDRHLINLQCQKVCLGLVQTNCSWSPKLLLRPSIVFMQVKYLCKGPGQLSLANPQWGDAMVQVTVMATSSKQPVKVRGGGMPWGVSTVLISHTLAFEPVGG